MYKRRSYKQSSIALFFVISICISCTNVPHVKPTQTANAGYQIVYQDGDFVVQEMFLGSVINWDWENFVMPQARIADSTHKLYLGREMACNIDNQSKYPCKESIEVSSESGTVTTFTLESEYQLGNGNFILKKNQQIVWVGRMNGGVAFPIHSLVRYNEDDIAFEYTDSNYDGVNPNFWLAHYILITNGYNVTIVDSAFAPNSVFAPNLVDSNLIYFKKDGKKDYLIFKGEKIGDRYDSVFNQYCCWDGPPIQINGNGKIIDFFAKKNNGWYHIQAGIQE